MKVGFYGVLLGWILLEFTWLYWSPDPRTETFHKTRPPSKLICYGSPINDSMKVDPPPSYLVLAGFTARTKNRLHQEPTGIFNPPLWSICQQVYKSFFLFFWNRGLSHLLSPCNKNTLRSIIPSRRAQQRNNKKNKRGDGSKLFYYNNMSSLLP